MKDIDLAQIQYESFSVEECGKIDINELMNKLKEILKSELLKVELDGLQNNIKLASSKTGNGGMRYWFFCPQCNKRVGVLYRRPGSDSLVCRRCGNLQYSVARYHRSPQEEHARLIKRLLKDQKKKLAH